MLKSRKLTIALFIGYLLALSWVILFKNRFAFAILGLRFSFVNPDITRSINLNPFGGMLYLNGAADYGEVILNGLAFVPFGIFLCMLTRKKTFASLVLPFVLTSLMYETIQYIFAIGASDITDVIANSIGGIAGAGIFYLSHKLFKENVNRVLNAAALTMAIGFVLILGMIRPL